MTNSKTTRKALVLSLLSLLLCCSMLVGTTFAWFTDSVQSGNNKIVAGNLDVDVFYGDPALKQSIEGVSTLFNDVTLWEPGAVAYENLTVANLGTLALKYRMSVNFANENYVLVDGEPAYALPQILQVGLVPGGIEDGLSREAVVGKVADWYPMESYTWEDALLANTNAETMGVVIWWEPGSADNNWNLNNGKTTSDGKDYLYVDLGITLEATQKTEESDSFDNKYDESAEYPKVVGGTMEAGAIDELVLPAGRVTVIVPAGSPAGNYKLSVDSLSITVDDDDVGDLDTNFSVVKDGVPTEDVEYTVRIRVDIMSKDLKVTHKGEEITDFTYDPFTGIVEFKTDSFSPFAVDYTVFGKEVVLNDAKDKILSGFFTEVNPATLDASLLGDESEYIAVDYVKDGKKTYSVSKRATTIIVGDNDDGGSGYSFENGNYPVTMINDNTLCTTAVLKLNEYDHGTLYILPGTYEEQRRLDVYGSMDIIGLGDAENIKLIKVSTTSTGSSHQHLINCSGGSGKAVTDHIQVTIRNLYLDATVRNGSGWSKKDNGPVQSIRKSKVKCYDLIIVDDSTAAFYINAGNDVGGVFYDAYMYAENCVVNAKSPGTVISVKNKGTALPYFYYSGLSYANGEKTYSNTSSYSSRVRNCVMAWDDWDWKD